MHVALVYRASRFCRGTGAPYGARTVLEHLSAEVRLGPPQVAGACSVFVQAVSP